jgi:hypothetical protein
MPGVLTTPPMISFSDASYCMPNVARRCVKAAFEYDATSSDVARGVARIRSLIDCDWFMRVSSRSMLPPNLILLSGVYPPPTLAT